MSAVILLIHEHDLARRFVTHVLERQGGHIVLAAPDSDTALHLLHQQELTFVPDVLVVSSTQQLTVLSSPLRRHLPDARRLPILVLDELASVAISPAVTRVAADPESLILKLKAVLRTITPEQAVLECESLQLDPLQQQAFVKHQPFNLSALAFRLLYFLMAHPGRVYTRTQLLEAVWPG